MPRGASRSLLVWIGAALITSSKAYLIFLVKSMDKPHIFIAHALRNTTTPRILVDMGRSILVLCICVAFAVSVAGLYTWQEWGVGSVTARTAFMLESSIDVKKAENYWHQRIREIGAANAREEYVAVG